MVENLRCPECSADWSGGQTCTENFHLMGFWEMDYRLLDVHHLMVLCYHIQHPSRYSPAGLSGALQLLSQFVEQGITAQAARKRDQRALDSSRRKYKIKATPQSHGAYLHSVQWTMTAADVIAGGMDNYYVNVQAWARSILDALGASGNLTQL